MGTRTYAPADLQCRVVIERYSDEWSSKASIMVDHGYHVPLTPDMMLNLISTLVYVYQGHTGDWPSMIAEGKIKTLDATKEDTLYMGRCKNELDKRDGIAAPATSLVTRVRVRPAPPLPEVAPVSPPVFRTRSRPT